MGKALVLKDRIKSYFAADLALNRPGLPLMIAEAAELRYTVTESEPEALLLEARLIRRLKPKFNIRLRDDKSFQLITINFNPRYPIVGTAREKDLEELLERTKRQLPSTEQIRRRLEHVEYYGPFPSAWALKQVMQLLRKLWPYRDCPEQKFRQYSKLERPCLYGHLGLCPGPCQWDEKMAEYELYENNINQIRLFLRGEQKQLKGQLMAQIRSLAEIENFEAAALLRDRLMAVERFRYVVESFRTKPMEEVKGGGSRYDPNTDLAIEAIDISNNQGEFAVGSLVRAVISHAKVQSLALTTEVNKQFWFDKAKYRKYKIRTVSGISDTEMMQEVLMRRLRRAKQWPLPDVFLLDGGIGQYQACQKVLQAWSGHTQNLKPPLLVAVAKGPTRKRTDLIGQEWKEVSTVSREAWHLTAEKLREEAHRFAIDYYRGLHRKSLLQ